MTNIQNENFLKILSSALIKSKYKLTSPDWDSLVDAAKRHKVVPIFYSAVYSDDGFKNSVPKQIIAKMNQNTFLAYGLLSQRDEFFMSVYQEMINAGAKPVLLKGLICRDSYGDMGQYRPSGDEDIYIKQADFNKCKDILLKNEFVTEYVNVSKEELRDLQEITFVNEKEQFSVELHVNLMSTTKDVYNKMNAVFNKSIESSRWYELDDGTKVISFEPTDNFLYIFFHFYKHFITSGVGIRQLIDIIMFGRKYIDQINWKKVDQVSKNLSVSKLLGDICFIAQKYFNVRFPIDVKAAQPDLLIDDLMQTGVFGTKDQLYELSSYMSVSAADKSNSGLFRAILPTFKTLRERYPVLYKCPFLLPLIYLHRWIKVIKRELKYHKKGSVIIGSLKVGKRRSNLIKMYDK